MEYYWKTVPRNGVLDPHGAFRLGQHKAQFAKTHETSWWSAIIGLNETSIDAFLEGLEPGLAADILIPDDYDSVDRAETPGVQYVSCFLRSQLVTALNDGAAGPAPSALILGALVPQDQLNTDVLPPGPNLPDIEVPEGTVLTAVIDDGIAFAHNLFRSDLTRSRVAFANILPAPAQGWPSVGRILRQDDINRLLEKNTYCGLLDEDQFYRDAGVLGDGFSSVALSRSHGTHVMALAAGYEMDAAPANRPILCALLPSAVTENSTGQNLLPSLTLALRRITRQAARFVCPDGTRPPLVVNFSYGNFSGPHDGTSPVEEVFAQYFGQEGDQIRRLVLPVGNGNLSQTHGRLSFEEGPRHLDLLVLPDDNTPSLVEMWMPFAGQAPLKPLVEVCVTAPDGQTSAPVRVSGQDDQVLYDRAGAEVARLSYRFVPWPTERGLITLSIAPTANQTGRKLAPSGQWRIDVVPLQIAKGDVVTAWIARDETIPGFRPGGRQSTFNNPDYVRFDALGAPLPVDPADSTCPVRRAGTQSGIATGDAPMVVAGYTESNRLLSDYSAAGPVTPTRGAKHACRVGPDAAALADTSPALPGVISAGTRSGSMVRMNGTSVAAPQVARLAVVALAAGAAGDRKWLWKTAEATPYTPIGGDKPGPTRTGGGQVNVPIPFVRE